eukprot:602810_1
MDPDYKPLLEKLRVNLYNVFNDQKFTNITFVVGNEARVFNINRVFIAAISPVFERMCYGQMIESLANSRVKVDDVNADAFQEVLKFAYCNPPSITAANIISIRHICDKYQIEILSNFCDQIFIQYLTVNNVCHLLNESAKYRFSEFANVCVNYFASIDQDRAMQSDGFLNMDVCTMNSLLELDNCVKLEEHRIFEYVLKWAEYQSSLPESHAPIYTDSDDEKKYEYDTESVQTPQLMHGNGNENGRYVLVHTMNDATSQVIKIPFLDSDCAPHQISCGSESIQLKDILSVNNGLYTQVFKSKKGKLDPTLCFSIVTKQREWDFEAHTKTLATMLVTGIRKSIGKGQGRVDEKHKLKLLKEVKKSIRFGLMDGEYIAKKVEPHKALTVEELVAIYRYKFDPDQGCGCFSTKKRSNISN